MTLFRLKQLNKDINQMMLIPDERKKDFEPKKGLLVLAKDPATSRYMHQQTTWYS